MITQGLKLRSGKERKQALQELNLLQKKYGLVAPEFF